MSFHPTPSLVGSPGSPVRPDASTRGLPQAPILDTINQPSDLANLSEDQLRALAAEIRHHLVTSVAKTGGHLGPNLGVVELTIALHRVFNSPADIIVFDTGHQSYVHKLLTGRKDFENLRQLGGPSGYPSRAESEHDVVENSHASAALSWADGIAKANQLAGRNDHVVVVVGDGALTGGMAWEALNNIAESDRPIVVVVNDNGRSYLPTIGGMAHHLDTLRTTHGYEQFIRWGERAVSSSGFGRKFVLPWMRGFKRGIKDVVAPQGLFEDLGIKYVGPVDGHDIPALERALARGQAFRRPVIVHAITEKGRGYAPAEQHAPDKFHAVGQIHPETGLPLEVSRFGWTLVFSDEIVKIAAERPDVVGITAAMLEPVGLGAFKDAYPDRVFDVGIAEQHAATSAAGMAYAGLHPVVALYATFLNRAFDQVLMDVALHHAGVTFVLDRAGITGDDGASHNGMWDLAMLRLIPGLQLAAPRDEATLRAALRRAVAISDAPTVVRYPKGEVPDPMPAIDVVDGVDVLARWAPTKASTGPTRSKRILVVGIGAMAPTALQVGSDLSDDGHPVTVVSPVWVLPTAPGLVELARAHDVVVTLEDGIATGGVGADLTERLAGGAPRPQMITLGLPTQFIAHASRAQVTEQHGLTPQQVLAQVRAAITE